MLSDYVLSYHYSGTLLLRLQRRCACGAVLNPCRHPQPVRFGAAAVEHVSPSVFLTDRKLQNPKHPTPRRPARQVTTNSSARNSSQTTPASGHSSVNIPLPTQQEQISALLGQQDRPRNPSQRHQPSLPQPPGNPNRPERPGDGHGDGTRAPSGLSGQRNLTANISDSEGRRSPRTQSDDGTLPLRPHDPQQQQQHVNRQSPIHVANHAGDSQPPSSTTHAPVPAPRVNPTPPPTPPSPTYAPPAAAVSPVQQLRDGAAAARTSRKPLRSRWLVPYTSQHTDPLSAAALAILPLHQQPVSSSGGGGSSRVGLLYNGGVPAYTANTTATGTLLSRIPLPASSEADGEDAGYGGDEDDDVDGGLEALWETAGVWQELSVLLHSSGGYGGDGGGGGDLGLDGVAHGGGAAGGEAGEDWSWVGQLEEGLSSRSVVVGGGVRGNQQRQDDDDDEEEEDLQTVFGDDHQGAPDRSGQSYGYGDRNVAGEAVRASEVAPSSRGGSKSQPSLHSRGGFFRHKAQLLVPLHLRRVTWDSVSLAQLLGLNAPYTNDAAKALAAQLPTSPLEPKPPTIISVDDNRRVSGTASGGVRSRMYGWQPTSVVGGGKGPVLPYYRYGIGSRGQVKDLLRQARLDAAAGVPERLQRRLFAAAKVAELGGTAAARGSTGSRGEQRKSVDWEEERKGGRGNEEYDWDVDEEEEEEEEEGEEEEEEEAEEKEAFGFERGVKGLSWEVEEEETLQALEDEMEGLAGRGGRVGASGGVLMTSAGLAVGGGRGQGGAGSGGERGQDSLQAFVRAMEGAGDEEGEEEGQEEAEEEEEVEEDGSDIEPYGTLSYNEDEALHDDDLGEEGNDYEVDDVDDASDDNDADLDDRVDALLDQMLGDMGRPEGVGEGAGTAATGAPMAAAPSASESDLGIGQFAPGIGGGSGVHRDVDLSGGHVTSTTSGEGGGGGGGSTRDPTRPNDPSVVDTAEAAAGSTASSATAAAAAAASAASALPLKAPPTQSGPREGAVRREARAPAGYITTPTIRTSGTTHITPDDDGDGGSGSGGRSQSDVGRYLATAPEGWQEYGSRMPLPGTSAASRGQRSPRGRMGGAGGGGNTSGSGRPSGKLVVRAFLYCLGRDEVHDALWRYDMLDRFEFVPRMRDADVVLHRAPAPGERQFALEKLRTGAKSARIPFVTVRHDASEEELDPVLLKTTRRFDSLYEKVRAQVRGDSGGAGRHHSRSN